MRLVSRGIALCACVALWGCPNSTPVGAGGLIVLSVQSARSVDYVQIKVLDQQGRSADFEFTANGKDLTSEPAIGEITPGMNLAAGPLLFIGAGYAMQGAEALTRGRVIAEFVAGQKTPVLLQLEADVIDGDADGYARAEDCNDQGSLQNAFFLEKASNDLDDNCDGSVDEGSPCTAGAQRPCYTGPPDTRRIGECRDGFQECTGGVWGDCRSSVTPNPQFCNGLDGDCDGSVDEDCPCTTGTSRPCWGGKVGAVGAPPTAITGVQGVCRIGLQTCVASTWGKCENAILPMSEACNGFDDDCDGTRDNGFDVDADGFTSCGTRTPAVAANCSGQSQGDGVDAKLADCDDNNQNRHPCQADRCGDMNTDDDCSGTYNECQTPSGVCGDAMYFAGWFPQTRPAPGIRWWHECHLSASPFGTECNTATGACKNAEEQCAAIVDHLPGTIASIREACATPGGCGGLNPAVNGAPVPDGEDYYNDCDVVSCDVAGSRVYTGDGTVDVSGNIKTGWKVSGQQFQCEVYGQVSTDASMCYGAECAALQNCQAVKATPVVSTVQNSVITSACRRPLNSYDGTAGDLGNTCVTTTAGNIVDPVVETITGGEEDPLGRCSVAMSGCANMVLGAYAGTGATQSCTIATAEPNKNYCVSGSCSVPAADVSTCDDGPQVVVNCEDDCIVAGSCVLGSTNSSSNVCHNRNGGTTTGPCGSSNSGTMCYSSTAGGRASSSCAQCSLDIMCGQFCRNCSTLSNRTCSAGVVQGTGNLKLPSVTGTNNECLCAGQNDLTRQIHCGDSCCPTGSYCSDSSGAGTCTPATQIPCGGGECAPTTHYCDTAGGLFTCAPLPADNISCNQRACYKYTHACYPGATGPSGQGYDKSRCTNCGQPSACKDECCGGASTQRCGDYDTGTCVSCEVNDACGWNGSSPDNCNTTATNPVTRCGKDNLSVTGDACADYGCVTCTAGGRCGDITDTCASQGGKVCGASNGTGTCTAYGCLTATASSNKSPTCCGAHCKTCGGSQVCAPIAGNGNTDPSTVGFAVYDCVSNVAADHKDDSCCGTTCELCSGIQHCASTTSTADPANATLDKYDCRSATNSANHVDACCGEECLNCGSDVCRSLSGADPPSMDIKNYGCGAACSATLPCCGRHCEICQGGQACTGAACAQVCTP